MRKLTRTFILSFLFLNYSLIYSQSYNETSNCTSAGCHENLIKKSFVHSAMEDGCETCHERQNEDHPEKNGNEFELVDTGSDLCETCHEVEATMKVVHVPFEDGECLNCHSPHSSNLEFLLDAENQGDLCETCHEVDVAENKFKHGPFGSNQCTSCHNGHESNITSLLIESPPDLCFQCHEERKQDQQLSNIHPPFEDECLECHSPHSSPAPNSLITVGNGLCFNCHDDIEDDIKISKVVHGAIKEEGQCVACHSPHATNTEKLLEKELPDLCFTCHNGKKTLNKEKIVNIQDKLKKNFVHDPVSEGECGECHFPHVSNNANLLVKSFPMGNYTIPKVESFEMCFECHDSEMLANPKTSKETNFRNGNRNLHYLHVMKKKSISCKNCHDVHGADHNQLIANTVFFGKWKMPLNYKKTESGGSCLPGCHVQQTYDRERN